MSDIKAIETIYNGYRFRSRLEARWAVFFNTLKIQFEYEKEGYMLDSGFYLPDFWLPEHECWIEIKGKPPTFYENQIAIELHEQSTYPIVIFSGIPEPAKNGVGHFTDTSNTSCGNSEWDDVTWAFCLGCNRPRLTVGKDKEGRSICRSNWEGWKGTCPCPAGQWRRHDTAIVMACRAAKQARFEHGEKG